MALVSLASEKKVGTPRRLTAFPQASRKLN